MNPTVTSMRIFIVGMLIALAAAGCTGKDDAAGKASKGPVGDVNAGKVIVERACKTCHGLDGKGLAPGIPSLAAQRPRYLFASLREYKDGTRQHAALKNMTAQMSDDDMRNVSAYFASLPAVANTAAADVTHSPPYEEGKKLAAACAKCHGDDGNSTAAGTPTLAGQQPHYLVMAIQEYHQGDRSAGVMESMLRDSSRLQLESLALYFAAQKPVKRAKAARGDPAAGEPLTAMCGGCHGAHGVSVDSGTPSLAGQDAEYLVKATKAYRTTRKSWGMQRYVSALSDANIDDIAAYYAAQEPHAAAEVPTSTQELAAKCDRCHDAEETASMSAPKMRGQDKDYLVMALRAYRDGKRESSTMHRMSYPYSNAIIESLASWYASQAPMSGQPSKPSQPPK